MRDRESNVKIRGGGGQEVGMQRQLKQPVGPTRLVLTE